MGNDRRKKKMQLSSSRRETTPGNSRRQPSNAIGCMSGLLQIFSRLQHSRRRIPSGNSESQAARKESNDTPQTTPITEAVKTKRTVTNGDARIDDGGLARRSPTLPLEIRRSGCCFDHADSPRRSSALLARLMGLEEPTPPPPPTTAVGLSVDSAEEKRRTLLCALERCDEDLRALKLIIDAIRTVEMRRSKFAGEQSRHEFKCLDANGEQPSPVSVLDASSSPKSRSSENASTALVARALAPVFSHNNFLTTNGGGGGAEAAQKKDWRSVVVAGCSLKRRMMAEGIPRLPAVPAAGKESCGSLWQLRWRTNQAEVGEEAMFEDRKEGATVIAELADDVAVDLVNSLVMEQVECCSKFSWNGKL